MEQSTTHHEKPWPLWVALPLWWLMPATAASRSTSVSLARAYGIHVMLSLFTAGLIVLFAICVDEAERVRSHGLFQVIERFFYSLFREVTRHPTLSLAIIAGVTVGVEVAVLALALLATPWGARDEPMRRSIANGLRRTWLNTTCAIPVTLTIGLSTLSLELAKRDWEHRHPRPTPRNRNTIESKIEVVTGSALQDYNKAFEDWMRRRPWYLRRDVQEGLVAYVCLLAATWFLWTVFRSVGADRFVRPPERTPLCESCGYNLTAARMDGRCPECGEPVVLSLGPEARPGTPWQRRATVGRWQAWQRCAREAVFRPKSFGRQIQIGGGAGDHRSFLSMHLPAVFVVGFFGIILCYVTDMRRLPFPHDVEVLWLAAPLVAYFSAIAAFACTLVTSWLVALYYQVTDKRNLLAGAMQMASYLATWLLLGACLAGLIGALLFALKPLFKEFASSYRFGNGAFILAFFVWVGFALIWGFGYLLLVYRGMAGCRYANR